MRTKVVEEPDKEVESFAELARRYCTWAEGEMSEVSSAEALEQGAFYLAGLYAAALGLARDTSRFQDSFEDPSTPVSLANFKVVSDRFACLPFQYYWSVDSPFDLSEAAADTSLGDICDDLADVYRELKDGLSLFDSGKRAEAAAFWTFMFNAHWGAHASEGLSAIHRWRSQ